MWWLWILNGIYISLLRRLFDIDILIIYKINIRIECVNRINYCMRWILCGSMRVQWLWCLLSLFLRFSFKSLKVFMTKQRNDIKCVACGALSGGMWGGEWKIYVSRAHNLRKSHMNFTRTYKTAKYIQHDNTNAQFSGTPTKPLFESEKQQQWR